MANANDLEGVDAWWRAANYLSAGQLYLLDNPLLTEPLRPEHLKRRLLGHWGTVPGLTLTYAHLNRLILRDDRSVLFVAGPGHGAAGLNAAAWLEGSYGARHPGAARDAAGMRELFRQFSFPGGVPSHASPHLPGSIHEGGELGYSLAHATGAVLDNPDLTAVCVIGDGEAETGPLATSWNAPAFLHPTQDGAVLPILHLNGYKIANPTVLGRMRRDDVTALLRAHGWAPTVVAGDHPVKVHEQYAAALESAFERIDDIRAGARRAARDHPGDAEGLDVPGSGERGRGGGHGALAPDPARRGARQPLSPCAAGGMAALVPSRGVVRRGRRSGRGGAEAVPGGRNAHERESGRARSRQRGPAPARRGRAHRGRRRARHPARGGDQGAGPVPA